MRAAKIKAFLEQALEAEFNFYHLDELCASLADLSDPDCRFILNWTARLKSTSVAIAHQFVQQSPQVLAQLDKPLIELWLLQVMNTFDENGAMAASRVLDNIDEFVRYGAQRQYAVFLDEQKSVLLHFAQALSGRKLNIKEAESTIPYTDTQTLYLPKIIAKYNNTQDNFKLLKAMLVHLWAQLRFGTFSQDLNAALAQHRDKNLALLQFSALETVRLDAKIQSALPGVYRDIMGFQSKADNRIFLPSHISKTLADKNASVQTSLDYLNQNLELDTEFYAYQSQIRLDLVAGIQSERITEEKALVKAALSELAQELQAKIPPEKVDVQLKISENEEAVEFELSLEGEPVSPPQELNDLFSSVLMDFGQIPEDYLTPAGIGQYDHKFIKQEDNTEGVWSGTYHEEGAFIYQEWDFARKHYKYNWCVMRELDIKPIGLDFYHQTLHKHKQIITSLRRSFEAMRNENKWLKRVDNGDEIDFDALINAWSDWISGAEMSSKLFMHKRFEERNIAVMFMVDVSGSTKGWINTAEREALILMAEALEVLGDRYAIYGFSGWARKRCEVYKVKDFDEDYDDKVKGKICNIEAKDYTRMGVAIRHLIQKLHIIDAKTKILITISDGKPDDYELEYRGQYGIEDTHIALLEARRAGIHPYCITIDSKGKDYLPQLYGDSNYTVIDQIEQLPLKIANIYRYLTT